ncbi:SLC13 family permease [Arenibacter amylolyticus]|uniref:SLC13 family permease n=1 Tax=Arenibacter amylolyticus TaxID=1406873 RepID=UPI000A35F35F|nr:DASS family sodium-coupled anion symporter [Arenibacter amylolyticus]
MTIPKNTLALLAGPLSFLTFLFFDVPTDMPQNAYLMLAATCWIAIWWITEAVPIAVTALIPLILFPMAGIMKIEDTTAAYGDKYVFLYLGGFFLAIAIEKWNLHRRIALNIIKIIGTNIYRVILGFMIATAFLSMWISNTATSVMMLPIGMSMVAQLKDNPTTKEDENAIFGKALMLGIAYSASIGGIATLIGTPPNLVMAGFVQKTYGVEITFLQWFKFGLPISIILLGIAWVYLTRVSFKFKQKEFPGGKPEINRLIKELGPMQFEEKLVLVVFVLTAFCWITRSFLLQHLIPGLDDTIIAMTAAIVLFIIPSKKKKKKLLSWSDSVRIPWGIILLFGGGMALAAGFQETGLAIWLGSQIDLLIGVSLFLLVFIVITCVNFLTEVTSNLATTAMLLPILAPIAAKLEIDPYILIVAATTAASCAFMLPVATPPNAVVFGSGYLRIYDMTRSGLWMNIISIIILGLMVYYVLPLSWGL